MLWIFFTYSFIGWCAEVMFAAVVDGKFVNRGFNTGPVCPIYGCGVLLVVLCLEGLNDNIPLQFLMSVILTSVLEFIVGFILEKFFHEKWWDYSDEPFNIKGYVCLKFSLLWGFACVFVINLVHPAVVKFIRFIPQKLGAVMLCVFSITFLADFSITLINVLKLKKSLRAIDEIEKTLEAISCSIGSSISDSTIAVMSKGEKLKMSIDEKEMDIELFKAEIAEKLPDKDDIVLAINKKLDEIEKLGEKKERYIKSANKVSKHLRRAFPHIAAGKYKHIFNITKK